MKPQRVLALDGLRGIAILAVILTHVPHGLLDAVTPSLLQPVSSLIFGNGGTGVAILFILTGFLMASIYPHPSSALAFWGKRFARLLPPFLTMVISLSLIRSHPALTPIGQLFIVVGVVFFARLIWETGIRLNQTYPLGKALVVGWLGFQALMALWYVFVLLKVPSSVFYLVWSPMKQAVATALVNASLTLPFGQYIGQLDGVYWSLTTEMFFYLVYPFTFVPVLHFAKSFSTRFKLALLLATVPASFGLGIIAKRLLGFEIMNLHLMIYFIAGTVIGTNLDWFHQQLVKYRRILFHPVSLILLFLVVFYSPRLLFPHFSRFYTPVVSIISVLPIGVLLLLTTIPARLSRWLSHPVLVYLGKISFSLYLTHAFIIDLLRVYLKPSSAGVEALFILLVILCAIIFSSFTYILIEKPYYDLKKIKTQPSPVRPVLPLQYLQSVSLTSFLIMSALYFALRSPVALLSQATAVGHPTPVVLLDGEVPEEITTTPYSVTFTANANRLGMISAHIRSVSRSTGAGYPSDPPQLIITLYDATHRELARSSYKAADIYEDPNYPFGFPVIADSKNKTYTVAYQLSQLDPTKKLVLVNTGTQIKPVYSFNKSTLLHQPFELIAFAAAKLFEPVTLPLFWLILLYLFPFISLLWLGERRLKRSIASNQDIMTS